MLSWLFENQAAPWLLAPLIVESILLVAVALYLLLAAWLAPGSVAGRWAATELRPSREIPAKTLLQFLYGTAPLLGLFGTVVGMTLAFDRTGVGAGDVGPALALQLRTTLLGLAIAIPSLTLVTLYPWRYCDD